MEEETAEVEDLEEEEEIKEEEVEEKEEVVEVWEKGPEEVIEEMFEEMILKALDHLKMKICLIEDVVGIGVEKTMDIEAEVATE